MVLAPVLSSSCLLSCLLPLSFLVLFLSPFLHSSCLISCLLPVSFLVFVLCPLLSSSCLRSYRLPVSFLVFFRSPFLPSSCLLSDGSVCELCLGVLSGSCLEIQFWSFVWEFCPGVLSWGFVSELRLEVLSGSRVWEKAPNTCNCPVNKIKGRALPHRSPNWRCTKTTIFNETH